MFKPKPMYTWYLFQKGDRRRVFRNHIQGLEVALVDHTVTFLRISYSEQAIEWFLGHIGRHHVTYCS